MYVYIQAVCRVSMGCVGVEVSRNACDIMG